MTRGVRVSVTVAVEGAGGLLGRARGRLGRAGLRLAGPKAETGRELVLFFFLFFFFLLQTPFKPF